MNEYLIVVDMQNDFVNGALGSDAAKAIVPKVIEKIKGYKEGNVFFTKDTHYNNYLETQEGKNLPVPHCIIGTKGWELVEEIRETPQFLADPFSKVIHKDTFGFEGWQNIFSGITPDRFVLIGLCTDICVISNAMILKAFYPEAEIIVDASCCAGVTPESHKTALDAMRACQIKIIGE